MTTRINCPLAGDFSLFGYIQDEDGAWQRRFKSALGIQPSRISMGSGGEFFLFSSYGDIAETEQATALKLGFVRDAQKRGLASKELLEKRMVQSGAIRHTEFQGNALVACFSKTGPEFSAYKTILGVPQLYYMELREGIICSDRLAVLVRLLDRVDLSDDATIMHFLFRSIPGELTYYRQIKRMLPGQVVRWKGGVFTEQRLIGFYGLDPSGQWDRKYPETLDLLSSTFESVLRDTLAQANAAEQGVATLLSGGVDSTLIQYYANQHSSSKPMRSFSYALESADFQREIQYARSASSLLQSEHSFISFRPEDFPGLLNRTIDLLAQPPILETEPSMLSIAEATSGAGFPYRYYLSGQGADTIFGLSYSMKMKGIHMLRKIPFSERLLKNVGMILRPFGKVARVLTKGAGVISAFEETDSFLSPANTIANYGDMQLLRKCFGDAALIKALRYRRELAERYLETDHYLEKFHLIDLFTDTYELGVQRQQLFLAHSKEQLHPFFDDEILRLAFSIPADIRYIKGFRPKYMLKDLLEQKMNSPVSKLPKGFSIFEKDMLAWMQSGPLSELVNNIDLPPFIPRHKFEQLKRNPDYTLWIFLTHDLFQKRLSV